MNQNWKKGNSISYYKTKKKDYFSFIYEITPDIYSIAAWVDRRGGGGRSHGRDRLSVSSHPCSRLDVDDDEVSEFAPGRNKVHSPVMINIIAVFTLSK